MRRLILLALLIPSLAFAQSDNRQVGVFVTQGGFIDSWSTTGNAYTNDVGLMVGRLHTAIISILERTGTPYTVYSVPDSGNWGAGTSGFAGADSTWFRSEANCMGMIWAQPNFGNGAGLSFEIENYFTNEGNDSRGTQGSSPISGTWSIPCVGVITDGTDNFGGTVVLGVHGNINIPSIALRQKSAFANGDSVEWLSYLSVKDPSQSANITPIAWGADTIDGTGSFMKAWRWKDSYYNYNVRTGFNVELMALLAVGRLFDEAGYTPKNKLLARITTDHPFEFPTVAASNAVAETSLVYFRYLHKNFGSPGLPLLTGGVKVVVGEVGRTALDDRASYPGAQSIYNNRSLYGFEPHSHVTGIGNYRDGGSWDVWGYTDTTKIRQQWEWMTEALTDTFSLPLSSGYHKVACLPGGSMSYAQLSVLAKNGYYGIRAQFEDTLSSPSAWNRVTFDDTKTRTQLPWMYVEPVTRKPMWCIINATQLGNQNWADYTNQGSNPEHEGVMADFVDEFTRMAWSSGDWYFHGDAMDGPYNCLPMQLRRVLYIMSRTKRIMEIGASIRPWKPRPYGQTGRSSGGASAVNGPIAWTWTGPTQPLPEPLASDTTTLEEVVVESSGFPIEFPSALTANIINTEQEATCLEMRVFPYLLLPSVIDPATEFLREDGEVVYEAASPVFRGNAPHHARVSRSDVALLAHSREAVRRR